MFKFFRKYQTWLLAVGGSLLMVVFLMEGVLGRVGNRDPSAEIVGRINGDKLRVAELRDAQGQIDLINRLAPVLGQMSAQHDLQWALMLREANQMGLSASEHEISQVMGALGLDNESLKKVARELKVSPAAIQRTLGNWIIIQNYHELVLGLAHVSLPEKFARIQQAQQLLSFARQLQSMPEQSARITHAAMLAFGATSGDPRLSSTLLTNFVQSQSAEVKITGVRISADRYMADVKVDDKDVTELFERYKDNLPGEGERYGFGYRRPDRVKIEYLSLPFRKLLDKVDVGEDEVLSYYDANRKDYHGQSETQPAPPDPTPEVRRSIVNELKHRKARDLGGRIITEAQTQLNRAANSYTIGVQGYYELPKDFKPTPITEVASLIEKKFGVQPDVVQNDKAFIDAGGLRTLRDISQSLLILPGNVGAPFADYVLSARELSPKANNPLIGRRLQVGIASQPLTTQSLDEPSQFVFRLIAAEPSHTPASLAEVREEVERDAKQLKAFEKLVNSGQDWVDRFIKEGPETLAKEVQSLVIAPPPFPRREFDMQSLDVPNVEGVGRSEAFVNRIFDLASSLNDAGGVDKATLASRVTSIPVDRQLSLYVVRLDSFTPITRTQYEQNATRGIAAIHQWVMSEAKDDPFSVESISKRIGYVAEHPETAKTQPTEGAAE